MIFLFYNSTYMSTKNTTTTCYPSRNEQPKYKIDDGIVGRKLPDDTYEKEFYRQGTIYKNLANFERKKGVCYVPELSDDEYTYQDFLDLCGGNPDMAEYVFETVDWQHPESLIDGDMAEIGVWPCKICEYLYDTETHDYCPRCGRNALE